MIDMDLDEMAELRDLWMSRLMFGWMVGMPEHRTFAEYLDAHAAALAPAPAEEKCICGGDYGAGNCPIHGKRVPAPAEEKT